MGAVLSRLLVATILLVITLLCFDLSARAWGSWSGLLANPARRGAFLASLVLTPVAALSPFNLSSGRRADVGDLWIVPSGWCSPCWQSGSPPSSTAAIAG
jgi:hypothetical protein